MVSATRSGVVPKAFSRSAVTGRSLAATMSAALRSTASRPAWLSGLASENAKPALVVASASKPACASRRAEPASHAFATMNGPGRACSARNAAPFSD